jgi:hypothetical protein
MLDTRYSILDTRFLIRLPTSVMAARLEKSALHRAAPGATFRIVGGPSTKSLGHRGQQCEGWLLILGGATEDTAPALFTLFSQKLSVGGRAVWGPTRVSEGGWAGGGGGMSRDGVGQTGVSSARAAKPHRGRGTTDRRELRLGYPEDRVRGAADQRDAAGGCAPSGSGSESNEEAGDH